MLHGGRMGQFGQELRQEREARGVSIDEICAVTKVSLRHVEALEQDRLEELPGGVFRKGIMRGYVAAAGLDELKWIERFEESLRERGLAAPLEPDWSEFAENIRKNRGGGGAETGLRWVGVAVMVLVLLVCSWLTWRYGLRGVLFS